MHLITFSKYVHYHKCKLTSNIMLRIRQIRYNFSVIKISSAFVIKNNHLYDLYNIMTFVIVLDRRIDNVMWIVYLNYTQTYV